MRRVEGEGAEGEVLFTDANPSKWLSRIEGNETVSDGDLDCDSGK